MVSLFSCEHRCRPKLRLHAAKAGGVFVMQAQQGHYTNEELSNFAPSEKQWAEKAFVAVEKALSLDPDLAEAYLARGVLL